MKRQAVEEPEGAPPARRRPVNSPEPDPEFVEQPETPTNPEGTPREGPSNQEEQPGEPPNAEEVNFADNDEDNAYANRLIAETEESRRRYQERQRRRERGEIASPISRRPLVAPHQREPPREEAPEEMLMNLEPMEPNAATWEDSSIPTDPFGNHPSHFYLNQIHKLRRMKSCKIQLVKIHAIRIRPSETSSTVNPMIVLHIGYEKGVHDLISYQPSGECQEHCIVKRRGNPEQMVMRNRNYQIQLYDNLLAFLMACSDMYMAIDTLRYIVDSNPLIATDELTSASNGPEDSFIEQFRALLENLTHKSLDIKRVEIRSLFRPLSESLSRAEFARCPDVQVERMKFEVEDVTQVHDTIGRFGLTSNVYNWIIECRDRIRRSIRWGIQVPGFLYYCPSKEIIVFNKIDPSQNLEEFERVVRQILHELKLRELARKQRLINSRRIDQKK